MSIGLVVSLLILLGFVGFVILLIKMEILPIKSKKLERFLRWFEMPAVVSKRGVDDENHR